MSTRRSLPRLPLAALALALLPAAALAQPIHLRPKLGSPQDRAQRVLDLLGPDHIVREAWRVTKARFYDRDAVRPGSGIDWDGILARYEAKAQNLRTAKQVHALINRMLGELHTSHLALIPFAFWQRELATEFLNRTSVRAGCELDLVNGRYFVNELAEGGPADRAGLLDGDEVVTIDGKTPAACGLLESAAHDPGLSGPVGYSLEVRGGAPLLLTVRRRRGAAPFRVKLVPASMSLIECTRRSVRTVDVDGAKVGVIHLWHFMHPEIARILRRAIEDDGPKGLGSDDALVLDLRGRGGSADVIRRVLEVFHGRRRCWFRPVVCVTDHETRSAKEIFAWYWKRWQLGPIVGETTRGACIGCAFRQLSDGSVLMIPVIDVRSLTGGESLEGRGVKPTDPVADAPLPYRAGADPILKAALEVAAGRVRHRARSF